MIRSLATDVEVFPNMVSFTFVDLRDYFAHFGKYGTQPLTEVMTVKEIKETLDDVKSWIFYISDTDDSQLNDMVKFIEDMVYIRTDDTEPVRYDMFGFNNQAYDDMIFKTFMMYYNQYDTVAQLINHIKIINDKLISLQDDRDALWNDRELSVIRDYRLPWMTVDLFKIYALNSAGINIDKTTGERKKFGKSLKQTSINLKWHELLDFKLPPIDEEEAEIYRRNPKYREMSCKELDSVITNDFDRYVLPKYIKPMLHYNLNDVYLVCEIARQKPDEIKLRYSLSSVFKINFLCSARSNIADKLITKFYAEKTGLHVSDFKNLRTNRTALAFNRIIFPHICFKTEQLQNILREMKTITIYHTNKNAFCKEFTFYGTRYTLATGGLHSQDKPGVLKSTDEYVYTHRDVGSFYPSTMIAYGICPKHLNERIFINLLKSWRDTRIKCKHTRDEDEQIMKGVHNKLAAEALKIVINAIYGKLGSDTYFLYDRLAQMKVTINGQLMALMLVEELELNGIHTVSANTDGIIVKCPRDKIELCNEIEKRWCENNKLTIDSEYYKTFVTRDINNYVDLQEDGTIEHKGALDPKQYIKDLKKGYDMPIVAKAACDYFLNGTPVMETLRNHKDILDFCKTQNVGRQFEVVYQTVKDGKIINVHSQRHVRFYVSTKGVVIMKESVNDGRRSVLASGKPVIILNSLDDKSIEERNIDYKYYYEETYKIINPIKLGISSNQKGNNNHKTMSGKVLLKRNFGMYNSLFDFEDE